MVGVTLRVTRPSRSNPRSVSVNIRCDTPGTARRISENRREPSFSDMTTSTLHLSPIRPRISLTVLQPSVSLREPALKNVPPCGGSNRAPIYPQFLFVTTLYWRRSHAEDRNDRREHQTEPVRRYAGEMVARRRGRAH